MKLYKYINVQSFSQLFRIIQIIEEKTIYIPNLQKLNDPFEALYYFDTNDLSSAHPGFQTRRDLFHHEVLGGILSLSETNDSILMWSHYTNGLRGICLEFDITQSDLLKRSEKVIYTEERPFLSKHNTNEILLRKSNYWGYEKEWRCIVDKGNEHYPIGESLNKLIVGRDISHLFMEILRAVCEKHGLEIGFADIHDSSKDYRVHISDRRKLDFELTVCENQNCDEEHFSIEDELFYQDYDSNKSKLENLISFNLVEVTIRKYFENDKAKDFQALAWKKSFIRK